ncbi:hypothetical protein [Mesorhizobium sp.]|uniref:hypothetical protein n=1 Tax=Mesorhizobium sp. TaxID=1871066 RepID=UPI0025F33B45|nr:hypothetical protein [Mesorhizobium sp.]
MGGDAPVFLSFAGKAIPSGKAPALRSELPSPQCSKDLIYLAGENCKHIAQFKEMKIFLFIFSNLRRFYLRKFNHVR